MNKVIEKYLPDMKKTITAYEDGEVIKEITDLEYAFVMNGRNLSSNDDIENEGGDL